ncbi:NAD dehydrogenase [Patellaria atrata CBS 101060]|uniref:L-2-hydroxyglutarate dehydrogenase, mitochondrial n=1 Tax=Patellaria atrata CBS 101060 TaxID=1346257 RepID=A0A9P4VR51_9PEZI|nr:NAD dehydrogenase [Patellaria atrata CBS 101060]
MFARPALRQLVRLNRPFSTSAVRDADFTHAVIGGGVVGLAVARQLQGREGTSTVLIERHSHPGTETSSRNSEVIHAGLYYSPTSLKTKLCLRGKHLLYDYCARRSIPHMNCGKWIVAQDSQQMAELEKVHTFSKTIDVPTHFVSLDEAKRREPDVRAEAGILESPTTGIVDSHSLMQALQGEFEDRGGVCAFNSPVSRIAPIRNGTGGWEVHIKDCEEPITVEVLINSAGLASIPLYNSIVGPEKAIEPFYAKGSYFSYSGSHPKPKTLVYPAPTPGLGGLGTHLTLDMAGRMRFGPDVEWVSDPNDLSVNNSRLTEALDAIQSYLPGIDRDAISLDYAGIRPKLGKGGSVVGGTGFLDFWIKKEEGYEAWVNLLGIESPGLTSCLAIAEEVEGILYK